MEKKNITIHMKKQIVLHQVGKRERAKICKIKLAVFLERLCIFGMGV
jgi:hypothetical protein